MSSAPAGVSSSASSHSQELNPLIGLDPLTASERHASYLEHLKSTAQAQLPYLPNASVQGGGQAPNGGVGGLKRTITLPSGETINLLASFLVSQPVVETMRQRIFALEDENDALVASQRGPPRKKRKVAAMPPTAAETNKRNKKLTEIFDRIQRQYESGSRATQEESLEDLEIKIENLKLDEFHLIFKGRGVLIQPTEENNPRSSIYIMKFDTKEQLRDLFGKRLKVLNDNEQTEGGSASSSSSTEHKARHSVIQGLVLSYSRIKQLCTLKFTLTAYSEGGGELGGSDKYEPNGTDDEEFDESDDD